MVDTRPNLPVIRRKGSGSKRQRFLLPHWLRRRVAGFRLLPMLILAEDA